MNNIIIVNHSFIIFVFKIIFPKEEKIIFFNSSIFLQKKFEFE